MRTITIIFHKLPKVNNQQLGENLPNLVILAGSEIPLVLQPLR
jgi:hypothetical protein